MSRRLHQEAARRGIRVLLDGHGGDEVVSFGYGRLVELALAGRWLALWREMGGLAASYGTTRRAAFAGYSQQLWAGPPVGFAARPPRPPVRQEPARYGDGVLARPGCASSIRPSPPAPISRRVIASQTAADPRRTERQRHYATLTSPLNAYAFEVLDRLTAGCGTEGATLWDKRLVEYCYALPAEAKLKDGYARHVLRAAMQGAAAEDPVAARQARLRPAHRPGHAGTTTARCSTR